MNMREIMALMGAANKKIYENIETNWYHGTDRDFDEFDNNFMG
jgi:hypothetical protein